MPIYALGELEPVIDPRAFVHPDAVIIGAVTIGAESSVWPSAVLRGDSNRIEIGARSSVQDGSVLHVSPHRPTIIGDGCTIGHIVHLEACTIESGSLVGSGSVVLPDATVESGAVVGANAVVRPGVVVPSGALAVGVPARIIDGAADPQIIAHSEASYVERARRYRSELRRLDL